MGLLIHVSSIAGRSTLPYMALLLQQVRIGINRGRISFGAGAFGIDSVVVEPGAFKTAIFEKPFFRGEAVEQEYGKRDYSRRIHETFQAVLSDPAAPPASAVAEVFLRLIETPAGQRPFRTHVGNGTEFLEPYNQMAEQIRQGTAEYFNIKETLTLNGR